MRKSDGKHDSCGFNPQSRSHFFSFPRSGVTTQYTALTCATLHTTSSKFGSAWELECLITIPSAYPETYIIFTIYYNCCLFKIKFPLFAFI